MSNEKIYENKKEDNKAFGKFILLIIAGMFVGAIIGALSMIVEKSAAETISIGITGILTVLTPYVNLVLTIVFGGIMIYLYKKGRKLYRDWNGEDEEQIDHIEMLLCYASWASAILIIFVFFFFAAGFQNLIISGDNTSQGMFSFLGNFALFMFGFIFAICFSIIMQQKIVNFEKEINPEKNGSVFDTKFSKKWIESCDEAERLNIYKSAYKAHQTVTMTCIILWGISILGMMIWDIGILPAAMVTIIWFVQTSSYCMESIRLAKRKNK
jgi:hypothetical protein